MDEPAFALRDATVGIVGLGLMGGSLALALSERKACKRIVAVERNAATRAQALERNIVAQAGADLALVAQADVVVLATPVRTILDQLPLLGRTAHSGTIVMDLGSTKREIVEAMQALPEYLEPIGGHPMCGKESAGWDAADGSLFGNAAFVLTPLARTAAGTVAFTSELVVTLGARPLVLDASRHDRIVAAASHLPFALASALVTTANDRARADELVFALAASGFRDVSRLAASDTTMMGDVLLTNSRNVADAIRDCTRHLSALADLIERQDEAGLLSELDAAAVRRRSLFR
jgi:prephenate dehydrogenase